MPYIVNTYNGQQIAIVNDGTIDQSLDIKLIGKNYAGFGEILNENLVHLLENFSGSNQPPNALPGQIWYDTGNKVIKFYDGTRFRIAGGAEVGPIAPPGLATGDFWWEDEGQQLYVYNGNEFILVGPVATGGEGVSTFTSRVLKDTLGNNKTVLQASVNDQVIGLVSKDEFIIDEQTNAIPGFSSIKKGFNLASKQTYIGMRYWGTAEDSDNLGGIPAAQYVLNSGLQSFADIVSFRNDDGLVIGAGSDLKLHITNSDEGNVTNQVGNTINFNVNTTGSVKKVGQFVDTEFTPATDNTGAIGSSALRWANGYFYDISLNENGELDGNVRGDLTGNVTGNLTGNVTGNVISSGLSTFNNLTVTGTLTANLAGTSTTAEKLIVDGGTARTALTTATSNSIAARDSNGDISANTFNGTATNASALGGAADSVTTLGNTIVKRDAQGDVFARIFSGTATAARYADLAENYLGDNTYEPGTVLIFGGHNEVTTTKVFCDHRIAGIVSTEPAHLMNSQLHGDFVVTVALRGRVPCKVEGPVNKGDLIVTSPTPGVATALTKDSALPSSICILGRSLENNTQTGVKLVEVAV